MNQQINQQVTLLVLFLAEITAYFVERDFQCSFLKGLEFLNNEEIMFDFLGVREQLDPIMCIGIEGTEVVKTRNCLWDAVLRKEESARSRDSVLSNTIWTQQVLKIYHEYRV